MSKFRGAIGFVTTTETEPGVWTSEEIEMVYSGDVLQTMANWKEDSRINPDLEINHTISIICDNYILHNMFALQYVSYLGRRWKVRKIELKPPRLLLTLGSEYIKEGDYNDRVTSDQGSASCS